MNRTAERAAQVVAALAGGVGRVGRFDDDGEVAQADLVVNATPVGMAGRGGGEGGVARARRHCSIVARWWPISSMPPGRPAWLAAAAERRGADGGRPRDAGAPGGGPARAVDRAPGAGGPHVGGAARRLTGTGRMAGAGGGLGRRIACSVAGGGPELSPVQLDHGLFSQGRRDASRWLGTLLRVTRRVSVSLVVSTSVTRFGGSVQCRRTARIGPPAAPPAQRPPGPLAARTPTPGESEVHHGMGPAREVLANWRMSPLATK